MASAGESDVKADRQTAAGPGSGTDRVTSYAQSATRSRSAYSAISSSPVYFCRGQKKPRRPSPLVRGTTWTCTWGTAWLTTLFCAIHEPCRAQPGDDRRRAALHHDEQRGQQRDRHLGERHHVATGHDEHVALEHRPDVEERDDVGLVDDDVRGGVARDDRAEQAAGIGHVDAVTRRPAALPRSGRGTPLRGRRWVR